MHSFHANEKFMAKQQILMINMMQSVEKQPTSFAGRLFLACWNHCNE